MTGAKERGAVRATVFMGLGVCPNFMDRFMQPTSMECFFS
jgi:hypothetical protein